MLVCFMGRKTEWREKRIIYCEEHVLPTMSPNVCFKVDEDEKWLLREHIARQHMLLRDWLKEAVKEKMERENSGE